MATKKPTKASQQRAEREHRKAVRSTNKALNIAFINLARSLLIVECSKPPVEFSLWGATRTGAWLKMAQQAVRMARRVRVKAEELDSMRWRLSTVRDWPLDQCQQFINQK